MLLRGLIVRGAGHRVRTLGQASPPYHSLISPYLLTMAYRRPLLDGLTLLTLAASGVIVFYPIIKSYRERK